MQYYELVILTNRPLLLDALSGSNDIQKQRQQLAHTLCVDAAGSITNLVQIYRRHYKSRQTNLQVVHIVFTAALILVYVSCSPTRAAADKALLHLQVCTQALGELSQSFRSASRALEVVMVFKSRWHAQARAQSRSKRQRPVPKSGVKENSTMERQAEKRRLVTTESPEGFFQNTTQASQDSRVEGLEPFWAMPDPSFTEGTIWEDNLLQDGSVGFPPV